MNLYDGFEHPVEACKHQGFLVSFPDPNNPSADRFHYHVWGRRVWGFDQG